MNNKIEFENNLEDEAIKLLIQNDMTISTAESCTGGLLSATLINYPGASKMFKEGCITYSNEAKIDRLKVKKETLDKYGAVSEQVAKEMAIGIASNFNTNVAISTTGIAGPSGGSKEKPVGLVYIAIYINNDITVKKYIFNGNRQKIRIDTVENALKDLIERLKI